MLQGKHSAILSSFIKLQFVIKIFVLSIFEWPFYTGFTVFHVIGLKLSLRLDVLTLTQRNDDETVLMRRRFDVMHP